MKRDKYNLEVGTKIEWVLGGLILIGCISVKIGEANDLAYKVDCEDSNGVYYVHPRQITKVWRKK